MLIFGKMINNYRPLNSKFFLSTIIILSVMAFLNVHAKASGIADLLAEYVDLSQQRMAMEILAGETGVASDAIDNILLKQNDLTIEITNIVQDKEMKEIVAGYILDQYQGEDLQVLIPFVGDSDRLKGMKRSLQNDFRNPEFNNSRGKPFSAEAYTISSGAVLLNQPSFSSGVANIINGETEIIINEIHGNFYKIECSGLSGYLHYSYLKRDSLNFIPEDAESEYRNDRYRQLDIRNKVSQRDISNYTPIRNQRPTYYVTAMEEGFSVSGKLYGKNYDGSEIREVKRPDGSVIARTSGRFFAALSMQGSGVLKNGRGVTWISNYRFKEMPDGCMGVTASGNWVIPFHTLAVNPRMMSYRNVYYIPGTDGLRLPDGQIHDGYWFAHDTGGAFQNTADRIDMYVKTLDWADWMGRNFAPSLKAIKVYRVDAETRNRITEKYKDLMTGASVQPSSPVLPSSSNSNNSADNSSVVSTSPVAQNPVQTDVQGTDDEMDVTAAPDTTSTPTYSSSTSSSSMPNSNNSSNNTTPAAPAANPPSPGGYYINLN